MNWRIPLFDIDFNEKELESVTSVIKSKWLSMGKLVDEFEDNFAEFIGVKYAIGVSNCTSALHLAYKVLGIKEGDEVICPSLSFVATSNSIIYTGAKPVFADITSLEDLTICPADIENKITPKTKAIVVVHYAGYPCQMDKILNIAKKYHLKVIEDCAHAPGAEYKSKKCGSIGDIGCFSFFSNKNMTTGEGGMITTNNKELASKIMLMRSHGMTRLTLDRYQGHAYTYDVIEHGYNYRLSELNAALGLVQLKKLGKNNRLRKEISAEYIEAFKDEEKIIIPFKDNNYKSSYHIFPIILADKIDRLKFMDSMKEVGIQTSIHYPPIHLFSFYRSKLGYQEEMLPKTEEVAKREVTLPLYPQMSSKDVEFVINSVKEIIKRGCN